MLDSFKRFQYNRIIKKRECKLMIIRNHYIDQIRPFFESDLIKVVTGIRRCGKSVIMSQIADEFRSAGKPVLFINFELMDFSDLIPDAASLVQYVRERLSGSPAVHFDWKTCPCLSRAVTPNYCQRNSQKNSVADMSLSG